MEMEMEELRAARPANFSAKHSKKNQLWRLLTLSCALSHTLAYHSERSGSPQTMSSMSLVVENSGESRIL